MDKKMQAVASTRAIDGNFVVMNTKAYRGNPRQSEHFLRQIDYWKASNAIVETSKWANVYGRRSLPRQNAPVHGVGMQAHLIVGNVPNRSDLEAAIASYLDAGAEEVAYTELDIRHASLPPTQDALQAQADDYAVVAAACLAVDQCVGITVWDYTDRYSWIPDVFPGSGAALPYDEDLGKKPAWTAVSSVLAAAAAATATPTL